MSKTELCIGPAAMEKRGLLVKYLFIVSGCNEVKLCAHVIHFSLEYSLPLIT